VATHPEGDLPALLAGELAPAEAAAVHAHLTGCDGCRRQLAEVAFAAGELRSAARLQLPDLSELPPLDLAAPARATHRVEQPTGPASVVLAATDDGRDPAYSATRRAAYAVARRDGARVVLFDRCPELYLLDPYERNGHRGGNGRPRRSLLDQRSAARLGRPYLASQLAEASTLGVDGAAWVASGHGPAALAAACEVLEVERVVLPAGLATPRLVDRVRGHTLAAFQHRVPARISLADERGLLSDP
jgi:Putative zinc-finger